MELNGGEAYVNAAPLSRVNPNIIITLLFTLDLTRDEIKRGLEVPYEHDSDEVSFIASLI